MVVIHSKLNKKDLESGLFALSNEHIFFKLLRYLGFLFIGIATFSLVTSFLANDNVDFWAFFQLSVIGSLLSFGSYFKTKVLVNRLFKENNAIVENTTYTFSKDNILVKGETYNATLKWYKPKPIKETKNSILIFQNKASANIIPKRNFSETELYELKKLIE